MLSAGGLVGFASEVVAICDVPISQKICYVKDDYDRQCIDKPQALFYINVAQQIDAIYQNAPVLMKKAMCAIKQIKISKKIRHRASAFYRKKSIYFSWDSFVNTQRSYNYVVERKLSIYGKREKPPIPDAKRDSEYLKIIDNYKLAYNISYSKSYDDNMNHNLLRLFYHEVAHLIDDHKDFNRFAPLDILRCYQRHQQSNAVVYTAKASKIKGYRYLFPDQLKEGLDSQILVELFNSEYPTFYAMSSQKEDFAELMTGYIMLNHHGINYQVSKGDELLFDRAEQFRHDNIQPKLNIVKTMLALHEMSEDTLKAFFQDQVHCRGDFKVE